MIAAAHFHFGAEKVSAKFLATALGVVGLLVLIAVATFTDIVEEDERQYLTILARKFDHHTLKYGWSYALGWIGTVGAFVGAGLVYFLLIKV